MKNYRGGFLFSSLLETVRRLRTRQTSEEDFLWLLLRNRKFMNLKFRRQHQIGNCVVDFYNHEHKLVIELDGKIHLRKQQKEKDKARDYYLKSLGFKILRIKNDELLTNPTKILNNIKNTIFPSPSGRGVRGEG